MESLALSELPPIPAVAIEERHLAATGPGGQNVNKVATAVQLRVDINALSLAPDVFVRLRTLSGSRMTGDGMLVLTARRRRTQEGNRADAMARLATLIARAHERPAVRRKTRPSLAAKDRRMNAKGERGRVKQLRGKPPIE